MHCIHCSTLHCNWIQNKMLNWILDDILYNRSTYTALEYRTRYWTQFREMHCTYCNTPHCTLIQNKILISIHEEALHSNTEQETELNSWRCTVPVAALYTALKYRIRYWTEFGNRQCTRRRTQIQNKILNSIQENELYPLQHSNTEQDTELNSEICTVPVAALYTAL